MKDILPVVLYSFIGGIAIPIGAWLSTHVRFKKNIIQSEFYHGMIALGGGALMAAIALVLVPEGVEKSGLWSSIASFLAGGVIFMLLDWKISKKSGAFTQLVAMMTDYIPEALALGATYIYAPNKALLLALIMFMQNVPEGFNAFKEILEDDTRVNRKRLGTLFALLSFAGPFCALGGYWLLSKHENVLGILMLFSSGGILYLIFRDIAPDSKMENRWIPSFGAIIGFLIGIIGYIITK